MIVFVRTASVARGKLGDAVAAAKEISAYVEKQFGVSVEVMMPVGGNPNRIGWSAEYKNLGEAEELFDKMMADTNYGALVAKNAACFIEGSIEDRIWRRI